MSRSFTSADLARVSAVPLFIGMFRRGRLLRTSSELLRRLNEPPPIRVMTVNAHHVWAYTRFSDFRRAADRSDWYTADGWPVAALGRLLGVRANQVPGRELCQWLLNPAALPAIRRIALLGTTEAAGDLFGRGLIRAGRTLVWREHGSRQSWVLENLSDQLAEARPDLVLICVGSPHGEPIAEALRRRLASRIVSVGAGVEMSVGLQRPVPRVLGMAGLEWAWRLLLNPAGMGRRYLLECAPTLLRAPFDAWVARRQL